MNQLSAPQIHTGTKTIRFCATKELNKMATSAKPSLENVFFAAVKSSIEFLLSFHLVTFYHIPPPGTRIESDIFYLLL